MLNITSCPTCGSENIRKVTRTIKRVRHGRSFTIPAVKIHECPDCGERLYSPEAVRKIQASTHSLRPTG